MASTTINPSKPPMRALRLLQPDLYRSFAAGFALGAVLVAMQIGSEGWSEILPTALAAILPL